MFWQSNNIRFFTMDGKSLSLGQLGQTVPHPQKTDNSKVTCMKQDSNEHHLGQVKKSMLWNKIQVPN